MYTLSHSHLQPFKETVQHPTVDNSFSPELPPARSSRHIPDFTFLTTPQPVPSTSTHMTQGKTRDLGKTGSKRREIQAVVGVNAVLGWVLSVLGYFVVTMKQTDGSEGHNKDWIKVTIGVISICQVALLILKRMYLSAYKEAVKRTAFIGGFAPLQAFPFCWKSLPKHLLECLFHLIVFIPKLSIRTYVSSFGIYSEFALDDCFYLLILLRNYHTVELLYWTSYLSKARVYLFTQLVGARVTTRFLFSSYLNMYALRIVTYVIVLIVAAPGVIEYIFAKVSSIKDYYTIWGEYWVISVTQVPIGYGDNSVNTLFGNASLLISCFTGIFLLGLMTSITMHTIDFTLIESCIYSELLYAKYQRMYVKEAVTLVQRWWRLMEMRRLKHLNAYIITSYYSYLLEYRSVLTKCQRVKDSRFEAQIYSFHHSIGRKIHSMNEYLHPVTDAYALIQDIIRNEYRFDILTSNLVSRTSRYSVGRTLQKKTRRKPLQRGNINGQTGQGFARAKIAALHNVRGRLVQAATTFSPIS